ncbi:hypothetical protein Tco_0750147 [Tanacetum coccineum]|uniref:Aspartic peptidase DDI1-type domain-containing protein n=1 Tax=Tanacetum coccineum TaxID=301880 RepID=A0ABQ4Z1V4_9ASTR
MMFHSIRIMDPNLSLERICLGDDVIVISSDKAEGSGDWNSPEYQDTAVSKGKKVMNALSFYRMETDKISERYIAQCFVNGLEAFDGEINLAFDENLISNEFTVKLCLDYEFIINPEEDDFVPGVILGRSFLRLSRGIVDFSNGVITIYPKPDPFEDDYEKTGKSSDDRDQLLDFNFDDVPKFREELPPFICKIGKSNPRRYLTQEEAAKEELAIRISQRYALLEEERLVIKTMAYNDKYKKILDEIWKDKVELDGKTMKEDEEAVKRIKGEALKEKEDPDAFIFPISLERKVNENALADTGSDINTMPYRIFKTLGREDMRKVDRGITMIDHNQAEAMGKLSNVLCQVGVTTIIVKFLILDIPIDRDAPIVVGRGFLRMMGSLLNTSERIFSTFDGVCHQTFQAARFNILRIAESDSDDEEEYMIKRNKFGAPIYDPIPAPKQLASLVHYPYHLSKSTGSLIIKAHILIDHNQAEAMGKLSNVLCQVGVTTIIAKFLILDKPIDRDAPIVVGRGFLRMMGSLLNTSKRIFLTFDGVCHQTFQAARFDVPRTTESDSDDEEEYVIKRNKFGAPIYGPRPAPYLNCANLEDRSSAIQAVKQTFRKIVLDEAV